MTSNDSDVEVQANRKFLLISSREVALFQTYGDLYSALLQREDPWCHIYAHDDLSVLHFLVQQKYPAYFFQNNAYPNTPLALPMAPTYFALQMPPVVSAVGGSVELIQTEAQLPCVNDGLVWAVSALNGFCICHNIDQLVPLLADPTFLIAPWGIACPTQTDALNTAREYYIARFFRHFQSTSERITLPIIPHPDEFSHYIDSAYAERDSRWRENNSFDGFREYYRLAY